MQQSNVNMLQPQYCYPQLNPNAVNINIYSPAAYGSGTNCSPCPAVNPVPVYPNNFYSMYGQNQMPVMPYYPLNYNNMVQQPKSLLPNGMNAVSENNIKNTVNTETKEATKTTELNKDTETKKKEDKENKKIVPLTDDYIKSLENYMNNENPKVRLIAVKELLERFKEDENRKDNPSLIALLNKALRDTSSAIRFLALTILEVGYSVGNDETVQLLKEIESSNKDKFGQDSTLASKILLKMAQPEAVEKTEEGIK